jgi:hypothetical protein
MKCVIFYIFYTGRFASINYCNSPPPQTPWPESVSKLYCPSNRRLSAKLVPTFAGRRCHVVSVTDHCGHILGFLDHPLLLKKKYLFSSILGRIHFCSMCMKLIFNELRNVDSNLQCFVNYYSVTCLTLGFNLAMLFTPTTVCCLSNW